MYQTLYAGKPSTFLLMLAVVPTALSLVLMLLVRVHDVQPKDDKRYLNGFSLISMLIATYLMFLIISNNIFTLPQWQRGLTLAILFILLLSPIYIVIKAHKDSLREMSQTISTLKTPLVNDALERDPTKLTMPDNTTDLYEVPAKPSTSENIHDAEEELNLIQAMSSLNFWLLFVAMLCGMGSGLATINNISQIGESLGYTSRERSTLVSLWSIWNFLGRFGAGYLSDIFMHRKGWARPLVMALALATMAGGHIIIGSGLPGNLYVGSVLVGVCYGSQWSLMPTITSEIFGVLHMGTIFNTIAVASPVGSYILSVRIIGYLYDKEASAVGNSCRGTHCFMLSYFILASVSLFGFLVSLALFINTRGIYARIICRSRRVCE